VDEQLPAWLERAVREPGELQYLTVQGCGIAYRTWGALNAHGVIMVHGGGANSVWWAPSAHTLVDAGYRVAALDLSGHGDSGWRSSYDVGTWASEVAAVAQAAGATSFVIGHSMGAFVAIATAAIKPRFSGLVIIDSAILPPASERAAELRPHAMQGVKIYLTREDATAHFHLLPRQPQAPDYLTTWVAENSIRAVQFAPASMRWTWKFDPAVFSMDHSREAHAYVRRVQVPAVFIRGENSLVMTQERAEWLSTELGQPMREIVVPGRHHHLILEDPPSFSAALVKALAISSDPAGRPR
jgi:pimeloyl-ACP methyl ester carboxylesterase